jgi:hypothetical protein
MMKQVRMHIVPARHRLHHRAGLKLSSTMLAFSGDAQRRRPLRA